MRMRQNRGVCSKLCPFKLLAEFGKVLDDSVVYDGNFVVARGVRVGVGAYFCDFEGAVGSVSGVADVDNAFVRQLVHDGACHDF